MQTYKHTLIGNNEIAKWWPHQLNLKILTQNCTALQPTDTDFSYKEAFQTLDLQALHG